MECVGYFGADALRQCASLARNPIPLDRFRIRFFHFRTARASGPLAIHGLDEHGDLTKTVRVRTLISLAFGHRRILSNQSAGVESIQVLLAIPTKRRKNSMSAVARCRMSQIVAPYWDAIHPPTSNPAPIIPGNELVTCSSFRTPWD